MFPAVTESELEDLLAENTDYLFHPLVGLVTFEPSDVLRLADLLIPPPRRELSWDKAQPGIALAQRLMSVLAEAPPSIEEMLDSGRGDIGMEADESDQLPPRAE